MPGSSPGMTSAFHRPFVTIKRPRLPWEQPQPLIFQALLLVADAIDRAGPVVGDEHRAVLGENDIGRPAEIALIAFEPAGCKDLLLGVLAVGIDDDPFHP